MATHALSAARFACNVGSRRLRGGSRALASGLQLASANSNSKGPLPTSTSGLTSPMLEMDLGAVYGSGNEVAGEYGVEMEEADPLAHLPTLGLPEQELTPYDKMMAPGPALGLPDEELKMGAWPDLTVPYRKDAAVDAIANDPKLKEAAAAMMNSENQGHLFRLLSHPEFHYLEDPKEPTRAEYLRAFNTKPGEFWKNRDRGNDSHQALLMSVYLTGHNNPKAALRAFEDMKTQGHSPGLFSYTTAVAALAHKSDPNPTAAVRLTREMMAAGHSPSIHTITAVAQACIRAGKFKTAMGLRGLVYQLTEEPKGGKGVLKQHGAKDRKALKPDAYFYNTLIKGAIKHRGSTPEAWNLYRDMRADGVTPDLRTVNAMLTVSGRECLPEKAEHLMEDLVEMNLKPTLATYNAYLAAQASRSDTFPGCFLTLDKMKDEGFTPTMATYETLMGGAAESCNLPLADHLYEEFLKEPTLHQTPSLTFQNQRLHAVAQSCLPDSVLKARRHEIVNAPDPMKTGAVTAFQSYGAHHLPALDYHERLSEAKERSAAILEENDHGGLAPNHQTLNRLLQLQVNSRDHYPALLKTCEDFTSKYRMNLDSYSTALLLQGAARTKNLEAADSLLTSLRESPSQELARPHFRYGIMAYARGSKDDPKILSKGVALVEEAKEKGIHLQYKEYEHLARAVVRAGKKALVASAEDAGMIMKPVVPRTAREYGNRQFQRTASRKRSSHSNRARGTHNMMK